MLSHFWFDFAVGFYALFGGGLVRYLWTIRTPIDASVHRLRIPKLDKHADSVQFMSSSSDVGFV